MNTIHRNPKHKSFIFISVTVIFFIYFANANVIKLYSSSKNEKLFLRNVNMIDIIKGEVVKSTDIVVENGFITQISKTGKIKVGKTDRIIDLSGKYIMPGLIDAHVHLTTDTKMSDSLRLEYIKYLLKNGITMVRDMAGNAKILKQIMEDLNSGKIIGPDIYYSAFLGGKHYFDESTNRDESMVSETNKKYAPWYQLVDEGSDLDQVMEKAKEWGCTGVKIYGGFDTEMLNAITKKAEEHKLETWAHACVFPAKPKDVAKAGVKVLSHAYLLEWENIKEDLEPKIMDNFIKYESTIDKENINTSELFEIMVKNNQIFDPTIFTSLENNMDWVTQIVKNAYEAGVKICAGTDYMEDLSRPHPYLKEEISYYVSKCGFSCHDALKSATIYAAQATGKEDLYGSIEVGKIADLLVLKTNPLENLDAIKNILTVYKKGVPVD